MYMNKCECLSLCLSFIPKHGIIRKIVVLFFFFFVGMVIHIVLKVNVNVILFNQLFVVNISKFQFPNFKNIGGERVCVTLNIKMSKENFW